MADPLPQPRLAPERRALKTNPVRYVQARGEARRALLYETTLRLLREKFVEDITYQEISREAGVPLASCYHFFPGKMELLAALIDYVGPWFKVVTIGAVLKPAASWMDIVDNLITDLTLNRNADLAFAQLFSSWKIPRTTYRFHDHAAQEIAQRLLAGIDRQFMRSPFANELDVFTFAVRVANAGSSASMEINGAVTDFARQESQRATRSYLLNFLPPVLDVRTTPLDSPELLLPPEEPGSLWSRQVWPQGPDAEPSASASKK
ncbi:MAG: TetR/AcrR family transcriptional regulator [Phenylobacterium sp.]|uniref:TetR/AcrR family transcriptional regulator n=1 Tax=Phenylobacterium sp. TaxID=1871053 RepID=UPI001212A06B|nr:TetR/AcrR family transcriptional regulator [Phenylobacterium sp.]TAJ68862.1 MAG: TetR/AcrR family transcriptional regulator [Phenylobacterium sp.]